MLEHIHDRIDGWLRFSEIYVTAVKHFPSGSHFVEIGSYQGKSAAFMAVEIANQGKVIRFDCIDLWEYLPESVIGEGGRDPGLRGVSQLTGMTGDDIYRRWLTNMTPLLHLVTPIRLPSLEAAKLYPDASLDFVFVDASHDAISVEEDIRAWLPKVKPEGVLAGDDYDFSGVIEGVKNSGIEVNSRGATWIKRPFPEGF